MNYVDPSGLCEEGQKALDWAKSQIGDMSYSGAGDLPGPFGPDQAKCNIFVANAYNMGNEKPIIPIGFRGSRPPRAIDWFEGRVPSGFVKTDLPIPGDIISDGRHMGLVLEFGKLTVASGSNPKIANSSIRVKPENSK